MLDVGGEAPGPGIGRRRGVGRTRNPRLGMSRFQTATSIDHPPRVGSGRLEARHESAEITVEARHILDERGVSDSFVDDPARCTAADVDEFLHDLG